MRKNYFLRSITIAIALLLGLTLNAEKVEMIANGGFEEGFAGDWWFNSFNESTIGIDTVAHTGDSSALISITEATSDYWSIELYAKPTDHMAVETITGETVKFWAKCDAGQTRKIILRFGYFATKDDPQSYDWSGESDYYFDVTDQWTEFEQIYDPPEGYTSGWVNLRFFFGYNTENDGGKIWIDDVSLMAEAPPSEFGLIANGGFEDGFDDNWWFNSFNESTIEIDTMAHTGDSAALISITEATADYWSIELYAKPTDHMAVETIIGETVKFWARCDDGGARKIILRFGYFATKGDPQSYDWSGESDYYFDVTDQWTEFEQIYDPPEGYTSGWVNLRFFFGYNIENDGGKIWIDDVSLIVEPPSAVKDYDIQKISVYPNPVQTGFFHVRNLEGGETIEVISITGKVVKSVIAESERIHISTDGLTRGMYLVKVSGQENHITKLMIQK